MFVLGYCSFLLYLEKMFDNCMLIIFMEGFEKLIYITHQLFVTYFVVEFSLWMIGVFMDEEISAVSTNWFRIHNCDSFDDVVLINSSVGSITNLSKIWICSFNNHHTGVTVGC